MKKLLATTILVGLMATGISLPASASSEVRIKTEAMTIWFPKRISVPKEGCTEITVRYKWGYYFSKSTLASVTLFDKKEYMIGDISIESDLTPESGTANMKICSSRWTDEEEFVYFRARKGPHTVDLWIIDYDNPKGMFQDKIGKVTLR